MHWADNLSLDLLTLLMDALTLAPLMLLCIYRPDKERRSWRIGTQASAKCLDRYTQITLRALSSQESRRLVESLLRIENLTESVKESILQKAEGNPFFVEEVIRSLIESDVVYQDGERWVAKEEIEEIAVPDTIQSVIMARIDRLEDEVRYVLQSAAVIGRLFRHKLLQYTTQQEQNLDRYLWQLEESDLVYEERAIPELEYSFRHVLTQETAYNTILSRRRKEFHRKVAEGYEALYAARIEEYYEELAYHYSRSDDNEKALHYLDKAGDKAAAAYANQDALDYYARALEACEELGDPALATSASIAQKRGSVNTIIGNYSDAIADFNRMLASARRLGDRHLEGMALIHRSEPEFWLHEFEKHEQFLRAALAIGDEGFDDVRFIASFELGRCIVKQRDTEGELLMRTAEELAPRIDDPFLLAEWGSVKALWLQWEGRFDDALEHLDQYRRVTEAIHSANFLLAHRWHEALARGGKGEYEQALAILEEVIATGARIGGLVFPARALNTIGWIYSELQDHHRAMEWNTQGVEAAQQLEAPDPEVYCNAILNVGDNLIALGRLDEAEARFREVEHIARNPRPQDCLSLWYYSQHLFHSYGELWLTRSDHDKALIYADECLALAEPTKSRKNIVKGRRLRGEVFLAQGKLAEAEQEFTTALEVAQQVGNPPQLWKTLVVLGDLRQARGRSDDARQAYLDALSVIEGVAAGLSDELLRDTFMTSAHVQAIRQKANGVSE